MTNVALIMTSKKNQVNGVASATKKTTGKNLQRFQELEQDFPQLNFKTAYNNALLEYLQVRPEFLRSISDDGANPEPGEYRAFAVVGNSMDVRGEKNTYYEHDVILCKRLTQQSWNQKLQSISDFVIVHRDRGILIKRITEYNSLAGEITCHSLNPVYRDFKVSLSDVSELYSVIKIIDRCVSRPTQKLISSTHSIQRRS